MSEQNLTPTLNRQVVLRHRPVGEPKTTDLALQTVPLSMPGEGEVLRRTLYLDRSLPVAQFTLGLVLRRLQDWEGAKRAFIYSLKLCREFPPESILRLSDGESAEQLREASQTQLSSLEETECR